MTEESWFSVTIRFPARDMDEAGDIADLACEAVCGGDIGMGLHVCKRPFVATIRGGDEIVEFS